MQSQFFSKVEANKKVQLQESIRHFKPDCRNSRELIQVKFEISFSKLFTNERMMPCKHRL